MPAAIATAPRAAQASGATWQGATWHGATWHEEVRAFKRRLIASALEQAGGNRTHAARALGLQRTYLLRLVRELEVTVPPPARRRVWA